MSKYGKVLYNLLSITILIDFINGIWVKLPIGEVYRILIIILSVLIIIKYKRDEINLVIFMALFLILNAAISFMVKSNINGIIFDSRMILKAIYYILIFKSIKSLYINNKFTLGNVNKIILNNLYYTPFLFLISYVLKIGETSYANISLGFKSTFLSLNSINVALIVLFVFAFDNLINSKSKIRWLFINIAIVYPMVLLGTKSSLIFLIFIPIIYIAMNIHFKPRKLTLRRLVYLYSIFMIVTILGVFILINNEFDSLINRGYISELIGRQKHLFENRDLVSYLLSGRNWLLETGTDIFFNDFNIFKGIFGSGYFNIHNGIAVIWGQGLNEVRPIELDLFDIFYSYGIIGVSLTYGYVIKKLCFNFRYRRHRQCKPYFVATIVLLIFSLLGGHVFLEAISSTFLGLVLAGWYISTLEIYKNKSLQ